MENPFAKSRGIFFVLAVKRGVAGHEVGGILGAKVNGMGKSILPRWEG